MSVPRKSILTPGKKPDELIPSALPCETAFKLIEEVEKGNSSEFAGYLNFLKKQARNELPSSWSPAGKKLLNTIIDELPPDDATTWIEQEWHKECKGAKDSEQENLAMMLISRGWDYLMVPMFDVLNHRNGNYYNTYSDSVFDNSKERLQVRASRRIQKGEQVFTSYNLCGECDARKENYGTPEILRDYGFVEDYPQRWIFDDVLKFEIRDKSSIEIDEESDVKRFVAPKDETLEFEWLAGEQLVEDDLIFLESELERLTELAGSKFEKARKNVPETEMDVIEQYHSALTNALTLAIENFPAMDESTSDADETHEEL